MSMVSGISDQHASTIMQKQLDLSITKARLKEEQRKAENSHSKIAPRFVTDAEESKNEEDSQRKKA